MLLVILNILALAALPATALTKEKEQDCVQCGVRRPAQLGMFPVNAGAMTPLTERFVTEANKLVDHMELFGWTAKAKDGSAVTASSLRALLKGIKVKELDAFGKPMGASRFTAFFDPSSKTIFLNPSQLNALSQNSSRADVLGGIALHELFGLAKVEDEKYQRSALLLTSSRLDADKTLQDEQKNRFRSAMSHFLHQADKGNEVLLSDHSSNMILASGGTRVGGGGDSRGLEFKARLLESTVRENRELSQLVRGAGVEVEISDTVTSPVLQADEKGRGVIALIIPRTGDLDQHVFKVLENERWGEN